MKKIFSMFLGLLSITASAQTKGKVEVINCGNFKVHVYNSNDVMADASYIIEGKKNLVLMEMPLFKTNSEEFNSYIKKLNKPIEKVVTDYHLGGSGDKTITEVEGMPDFIKGPIYGGMMKHFGEVFGNTIVDLPTAKTEEVPFGSIQKWAGIDFKFEHGASTDFPGASIIIGNKLYYTHWTPTKAHVSNLQISSLAAVDAEIKEAQKALNSGCTYFIGGHGGAAKRDAVEFKIAYLNKIKQLVATNKTADEFVAAMKKAYPSLPGENGLNDLAKALYK
jgi:hypothetical protein